PGAARETTEDWAGRRTARQAPGGGAGEVRRLSQDCGEGGLDTPSREGRESGEAGLEKGRAMRTNSRSAGGASRGGGLRGSHGRSRNKGREDQFGDRQPIVKRPEEENHRARPS